MFKNNTIKGKSISLKKDESPVKLLKKIFDDSLDKLLNVSDILASTRSYSSDYGKTKIAFHILQK